MKSTVSLLIILFVLGSCQSNQSSKPISAASATSHEVVVKEVIQVSEYTYLLVKENGVEKWLATPPIKAAEGEVYYYEGGFEMTNFKSKELDKTFENILFLEGISSTPINHAENQTLVSPGATMEKDGKKEISITPVDGSISISELYSNRESYSGKTIRVKAEVTKFSPEIMGTNWIHVQDGTMFDENFDLTITSGSVVNVGDVLVFEGKITLDKDLGYGYFYSVLMEEAAIVK